MRTAGRMLPSTDTWPTPDTWLSRGAEQRVGDVAEDRAAARSCEVSASVRIGVSAGFTLE